MHAFIHMEYKWNSVIILIKDHVTLNVYPSPCDMIFIFGGLQLVEGSQFYPLYNQDFFQLSKEVPNIFQMCRKRFLNDWKMSWVTFWYTIHLSKPKTGDLAKGAEVTPLHHLMTSLTWMQIGLSNCWIAQIQNKMSWQEQTNQSLQQDIQSL